MSESRNGEDNGEGLTLECNATGKNGMATVTARAGADVFAVESLNLAKSKARRDFVADIAKDRPGIDKVAMEAELLKLAADVVARPEGSGEPGDFGNLPEIDVSRIIRPERFITSDVSGLAVPTMTSLGEKVVGRWMLYLRWANGRRERRALGPTIDLPGSDRLWVHPDPAEPTPNMRPGWTATARQKWLEGELAPNPAEVFKRLCEKISYFLDLPKTEAPGVTATLAIWCVLTYCFGAWCAVPYLYIGGPLSSGKTRVFEILARLAFRPLTSSNLTAASLFRTLHAQGGTLFLDEAERLRDVRSPDVGELLSALLAGYKQGGTTTRLEPVGESGFKTVSFDVYGPKALACISGLPPALASRCIRIGMFRAPPGSEKPRRRIDDNPAGWQGLCDALHALALEHGPTWLELAKQNDVCPAMNGRDFELWQPLLALASWLEKAGVRELLPLLQEHALTSIDAGKDDQTPDHDETLLRLLAESVRFGERPTASEILDKAKAAELEGFRRWTPRGVAEHFKRYGLMTIKTAGRKRYARVTLADFRRIEINYGIDLGLQQDE